MLIVLFLIAAAILAGSFLRPPRALWQRGVVVLASVVLLAVLVAWAIEFVLART